MQVTPQEAVMENKIRFCIITLLMLAMSPLILIAMFITWLCGKWDELTLFTEYLDFARDTWSNRSRR